MNQKLPGKALGLESLNLNLNLYLLIILFNMSIFQNRSNIIHLNARILNSNYHKAEIQIIILL